MKVYEIIQENNQINEAMPRSLAALGALSVGLVSLMNIATWAYGLSSPVIRYYEGIEQAEHDFKQGSITDTEFQNKQIHFLSKLKGEISFFVAVKITAWTFGTLTQFFKLISKIPNLGTFGSILAGISNTINKAGQAAAVTFFNSKKGQDAMTYIITKIVLGVDVASGVLEEVFPIGKDFINYVKNGITEPLHNYLGTDQKTPDSLETKPTAPEVKPELKPLGPPLTSTKGLGPDTPVYYDQLSDADKDKLLAPNVLDDPSAKGGQRLVIRRNVF